MNTQPTHMWSIKEAAQATGLSEYFIRQAALSGKVAAVRISTKNSKILINVESLNSMLQNSTLSNDSEVDVAYGIRKIAE